MGYPKQPKSQADIDAAVAAIITGREVRAALLGACEQALEAMPNVTPTQAMARRKLAAAIKLAKENL